MEPLDYSDDAPPPVQPNAYAAKTIGILNIVFGSLLLLCGICAGLNQGMQAAMGPVMAAQQQQVQKAADTARQVELRQLKEREKASTDAKEKATLQEKQKALEAQPVPQMPDVSKIARNPLYLRYMLCDVATGIFLNILMVISGIGLLNLKEWGRRTALWVAGLKIIRLLALYGYFAMVVGPFLAQQFRDIMEEVAKSAPQGQPAPGAAELVQFSKFMEIMLTAYAIAMIVLGVIYPLVVWFVLNRVSVKAACTPPAARPDLRGR